MAFQKFLLNCALVLIATITFSTADNTKYDTAANLNLQDNVIPLDYNVEIQYLLKDNILLALYSMIINITHPLESIILHSVPIKVIDAILIGDQYDFTTTIYKLNSSKHIREKNILILHFNQLFHVTYPAEYTLNMTYMRNIHENNNSFFRYAYLMESEVENQKFIKTGVEIIKARHLFPCRDDLAIKSTFKIAVKHHEKFTVLSNMPIRAKYKKGSTMVWTDFEKSILMSAQHIAVVITTFTNQIITEDTNVTIWYRSSIQHFAHANLVIMNIVPHFMQHYSMGLSKLDIVILPHSQDDNFATFGLLLQREAEIIYNQELESAIRKTEIAHVIARQLAFLWSYDVLLWLKEGFAVFFGAYILDKIYKDNHMMDLMVIQTQPDSLRYDTPSTIISEANSLVLPLNYMKSFIIWRMLYHVIPDDVFWTGIHKYIDKYRNYSSTTIPDDLWTTMQTILQENFPNLSIRFYLRDIINSWITKKYYPVLNMTRNYETYRDRNFTMMINYIQSPYLLANDKTENWIPVTYTTQLSLNHDSLFWLTSQNLRHLIPGINDSDLVIVNIQQTGYYRVNYDFKTWRNLILYLKSESYTQIHVLNRAQIIDDAFYFLLQQQFDYYMFWNLMSFVLQDINFLTWYPMFKVFESMSCLFPLNHADNARIKMKNIITPLITKTGYFNSEFHVFDLTTSLREEASKWACILDVSNCREMAAKMLINELENTEKSDNSILNVKWIYCYGFSVLPKVITSVKPDILIKMDDLYMQMLLRFKATNDSRFLEYLSCTENKYIIFLYLSLLIIGEDAAKENQLQGNERANVFLSTVEKHAKHDEVLSFIFKSFENLTLSSNRRNDIIAVLIVIITNVDDRLIMLKITDYVTHHYEEQIVKAVIKKIQKRDSEYRKGIIENYGIKLMQAGRNQIEMEI